MQATKLTQTIIGIPIVSFTLLDLDAFDKISTLDKLRLDNVGSIASDILTPTWREHRQNEVHDPIIPMRTTIDVYVYAPNSIMKGASLRLPISNICICSLQKLT